MARGLNKVMIIGYVGREPEMRYTPGGKPVTSFSVATTCSWTAPDGRRRQETDWFNVVSWDNLAEICKQHLTRDQRVYIEGRLQTRGWKDGGGKYLNAVAEVRTDLTAEELFGRLVEIETALGRVRGEKWGPRTIDLDLLLYGDEIIDSADLSVPHKQMHLRTFLFERICELKG